MSFVIWPSRRTLLQIMAAFAAVTLMATFYGMGVERLRPNHPTAMLGSPAVIEAVIQGKSVYGTSSYVRLQVKQQGEPLKPCSFEASWRTNTAEATNFAIGDTVVLRGLFVVGSGASGSVQNWLSPSWTFRGRVVDAPSPPQGGNSHAFVRRMENAMVESVPQTDRTNVDLALSMIVGSAIVLPTAYHNLFLQAGVMHLLAASGANVVLFCRFVALGWAILIRPLGLTSWWLEYVTLLCSVWLFVDVCGFATPIVRAALIMSYSLMAQVFRRRVGRFVVISVANFMFVFWQPSEFTSVSSLFSLVAVLALYEATALWKGKTEKYHHSYMGTVSWHNFVVHYLRQASEHLGHLLYISLMVDVYMLPLVWWWFQQLTPYGAVATVIVEPIIVVLLPLTVLWGLVAWSTALIHFEVLRAVARGLGVCADGLVSLIVNELQTVASQPGSLVHLPVLPTWLMFLYYGVLLSFQHASDVKRIIIHVSPPRIRVK
ncbi:ComEC/Rec2 family competence protein [Alicyclobacillus dauci]|uniref:ComEC/Rec2 family competence protein n=1 Tax=Alicyclobacillus dauci TaxID=1475485 RepID=A0ABY6Z7L8_9BACL|nr:ComEC/Rec2 family competence protein [Alicyclobacillus dauci]WAH38523.1 ComEC/Rec2 family competence protein [Alicyclobacillus dauci]